MKHFILFSLFILSTLSNAQIVTNGSLNGSPIGNSALNNAAGWIVCGFSPDLCNVSFRSYVNGSQVTAIPSPDGGNWLGMAGVGTGECARTTITNLTIGQSYSLCFYGACFGTGTAIFNSTPATPEICVGTTCQTFSFPMMASSWTQYSLDFTANASTMNLSINLALNGSSANSSYACLDGFEVNPIGFCSSTKVFGDTICEGEEAQIYVNGGTNYSWHELGFPNIILGTNDSLKISPTITKKYIVNIDGVFDTTLVLVRQSKTTNISTSICFEDSLFFGNSFKKVGGNYFDTLNSFYGCDSIVILNLNLTSIITDTIIDTICYGENYNFGNTSLNLSGTYNDTININGSCDSITTLHLIVNQAPFSILFDTICEGTNYTFSGKNISSAGIYYDTLSTNFNCDSLIELNLHVINLKKDTTRASICFGDSIIFSGQSIKTNGTFYDTITLPNGCDSITTLITNTLPLPTPSIVGDSVLCKNEIGTLYLNNIYDSYLWSTGSTTNTTNTQINGTYSVTVTNGNTCKGKDSLVVNYINCSDTCYIFLPNAFSPNSDGINDFFFAQTGRNCIYKYYKLSIFNKSGELLFISENINDKWNGFFKSALTKTDTYIWKLEYQEIDEVSAIVKFGHVTIIK